MEFREAMLFLTKPPIKSEEMRQMNQEEITNPQSIERAMFKSQEKQRKQTKGVNQRTRSGLNGD